MAQNLSAPHDHFLRSFSTASAPYSSYATHARTTRDLIRLCDVYVLAPFLQ